eukprot:527181-Rhodomonas_salina.3
MLHLRRRALHLDVDVDAVIEQVVHRLDVPIHRGVMHSRGAAVVGSVRVHVLLLDQTLHPAQPSLARGLVQLEGERHVVVHRLDVDDVRRRREVDGVLRGQRTAEALEPPSKCDSRTQQDAKGGERLTSLSFISCLTYLYQTVRTWEQRTRCQVRAGQQERRGVGRYRANEPAHAHAVGEVEEHRG